MAIVLTNAILAELDPPRAEPGALRIEQGRIAERAAQVAVRSGDEVVDCGGAVVMPGLVNGHTHLYSALAAGMPPPAKTPTNFLEILQCIWWRLDQALDGQSIRMSACIGALDAVRFGVTTLIDHHASPSHIAGSLDLLEEEIARVGLRAVLCYETTDRHGVAGREAGLQENRRYLLKCQRRQNDCFAGMVGAHASFTLEDQTLDELAALAEEFGTGVHIHVAEDACDEDLCESEHQVPLIDRLTGHGLLKEAAIFAHGTHLGEDAIERVSRAGLFLAHNPRSNMNNGVGYAPVAAYGCPVMLGTDGHASDMFTEARCAWFKACDEQAGLTPTHVLRMLANSARRASMALGVMLGQLAPDAAADVVITDYRPATPLTSDNLPGHFIYAMGVHHVKDVLVAGRWVMRDQVIRTCDEAATRHAATAIAKRLWERMEAYQCE
jgi:putative selenium metabolism protein SsnA